MNVQHGLSVHADLGMRGSTMSKQEPKEASRMQGSQDIPSSSDQGWLPAQRRDLILSLLLRDDVVRVPDLAEMMSTTDITIRRDLDALSKAGLIRRVRGGALSLNSVDTIPDPDQPSKNNSQQTTTSPGQNKESDQETTSSHSSDGAYQDTKSLPKSSMIQARLSSGQPTRGTLGVILPEPSFFWPAVTEHIRQIARDGFNMDVVSRETSYEDYPETGVLEELARINHLRGIIMAPSINPKIGGETWRWLGRSPVPVTVLEREPPVWSHYFIDSVHTNHPYGTRKGLLHFVDHGHTRIGLALGYTPTSGDIELGWHLMMQSAPDLTETFVLTHKEAYIADDVNTIVDSILNTNTTAVLIHPDYLSIAVAQALEQRGRHIPQDVSMISVDGYTTPSTRPLTVLRSSELDLARSAVHLLIKRMSNPHRRTEHIYVDPILIDRGSVADAHGRT